MSYKNQIIILIFISFEIYLCNILNSKDHLKKTLKEKSKKNHNLFLNNPEYWNEKYVILNNFMKNLLKY